MLQKEMKIGLSDVEKVEMKNGIKSEVLTSVAGGSPKGTYADLTALQSAFPNGAPGVYLTSNNGHWYYWNSTAWTDGGVYQAQGIADGSITPAKTNFFTPRGVNLFDKETIIEDNFRGYTNGSLNIAEGYFASDYIPVTENTSYILSDISINAHLCWFDSDKNYISGEVSYGNRIFLSPVNACYFVISDFKTLVDIIQVELATIREMDLGDNLYIPQFTQQGYLCESWTGNVVENSSYFASDYILVNSSKEYSIKHIGNNHIAYFDVNKTYISGTSNQYYDYTITTPSNAKYLKISDALDNIWNIKIQELNAKKYMSRGYYDYYKLLVDIKPNDILPIIVVSQSGKGDFKTITEAVNYAIDKQTVLVMPGTYENEKIVCVNKKISIIGTDKDTCILTSDNSTYSRPMITMSTGLLRNLTLILKEGEGYCIHSEWSDQVNNTFNIENCKLISYNGACFGCGMRKGYELTCKNTQFINTGNNACLYIHDSYESNMVGDMYPSFIDCDFINQGNITCICFQSQEMEGTIVHLTIEKCNFVTNATSTYDIINYNGGTSTTTEDFLGLINWRLDKKSWGNRVTIYNYDN